MRNSGESPSEPARRSVSFGQRRPPRECSGPCSPGARLQSIGESSLFGDNHAAAESSGPPLQDSSNAPLLPSTPLQNQASPAVSGVKEKGPNEQIAFLGRSSSVLQHRLVHQLATHRLHELTKQMPVTHRLANLQRENTVMSMTMALQRSQMASAESHTGVAVAPNAL